MLGVSTTPVRFPPLEADFELGVGNVIDSIDFWRPLYLDSTDSRAAEERLEDPVYRLRVVSPSYFETMQIPILSGREFEARDEVGERGFNRTILVSASFARRYWPGQNPLGRRISPRAGVHSSPGVGRIRVS